MELHADEIQTVPSDFHRPRVFTLDLVGRLAEANTVARKLRAMGLRVVDEDAAPHDGGKPVLLVDMNGHPLNYLRSFCEVSTVHAVDGRMTGLMDGVRILVQGEA